MKTYAMETNLIIAAIIIILCSGCATVTKGTTQDYQIETEPSGASVTLSTGETCTTPCTIVKKRKAEFNVSIKKESFHPYEMMISHRISGTGAVGFAGNALIGGVIGAGVDVLSGAALELAPNPLKVKLVPSHEKYPTVGIVCYSCEEQNPPGLLVFG